MKRRSVSPSPIGLSFVLSVSDLCRHISILQPNKCLISRGIWFVMMSFMSLASLSMFGYESFVCLVRAHHFKTSWESAKGPVAFPRLIMLTDFISFLLVQSSLSCFSCRYG